MKKVKDFKLGIMFRREHTPEKLPDFARRADEVGFDELWVVEDCFYGSGIASAAVALACTERISVGVGIMPAVARNPVFTAMEIATLAWMFPGRFLPGIGHGMAGWMRQIGAFPKSQLAALEEVTFAIRELLRGKRLTVDGKQIQLNEAELVFPPDRIPPISLGVRGPKSLALSGRVADGTILAEFAGPAYVSWAREQIDGGKVDAGHDRDHRLTVFSLTCAGSSSDAARQKLRPLMAPAIASGKLNAQLAPMGILPEVKELSWDGDLEHFAAAMPDAWIDELAVVGRAEGWKLAIDRLVMAGADAVVLVPLPDTGVEELDVFAEHFLP
jgi:alkanesulfonate monooxygenase SsuD/methylene tetrahydromethanopterin reductase-like flavin-dependent oxidoreductase (luciferase family)